MIARSSAEHLEIFWMNMSSPGLGRPLKKERDYIRSVGKDVEIRLYRPVDKSKEWEGELKSWDADTVTILVDGETEKTFERSAIALIRLAFDF